MRLGRRLSERLMRPTSTSKVESWICCCSGLSHIQSTADATTHRVALTGTILRTMGARGRASSSAFFLRGAPFLLLLAAGSWGLSHFLKLPVQLRDDAKKRKREGRSKFSLNQEHEVRAE